MPFQFRHVPSDRGFTVLVHHERPFILPGLEVSSEQHEKVAGSVTTTVSALPHTVVHFVDGSDKLLTAGIRIRNVVHSRISYLSSVSISWLVQMKD